MRNARFRRAFAGAGVAFACLSVTSTDATGKINADCLPGDAQSHVLFDPIDTGTLVVTPEMSRFLFHSFRDGIEALQDKLGPAVLPLLIDCWTERLKRKASLEPPNPARDFPESVVFDLHHKQMAALTWGDASTAGELRMYFAVVPRLATNRHGQKVATFPVAAGDPSDFKERLARSLNENKLMSIVAVLSSVDQKLEELTRDARAPLFDTVVGKCWTDILGTSINWAEEAAPPIGPARRNAWLQGWIEELRTQHKSLAKTRKDSRCVR